MDIDENCRGGRRCMAQEENNKLLNPELVVWFLAATSVIDSHSLDN
jgi:hypothetical protein